MTTAVPPARHRHTGGVRHGTLGGLAFAALLVALGTAPAAASIDLSGNYVGFTGVRFTVSVMQAVTVLQMSGHVVFNLAPYRFSASGTVDPSTGTFSVTGAIETLCADFAFTGTGDGEELTGTAVAHCISGTQGPGAFLLTKCGNGLIDPLENCEDGNAVDGDCCSARCRSGPPGTACASDEQSCTDDVCDASGTCTHVPVTGPCDDGNLCTLGDACSGGACVPGREFAPEGQACGGDFDRCTDDVCDAAGTCTHVPVTPAACPRAVACHSTCTQELKECRRTCPASGPTRRNCRAACAERSTCTAPGAPIRTLVYAMTECTTDAQKRTSLKQTIFIRRGNCDPVPVVVLPEGLPQSDPDGLCGLVGGSRRGVRARVIGGLQRLAVLPDGSGVVFEVTNRFSLLPFPPPPGDGFFFMRADGTGVLRLGDASRRPAFVEDPISRQIQFYDGDFFAVSPDGHQIALLDRGPDMAGHEADQIFLLDPRKKDSKLQLTSQSNPEMCCQTFLDSRTVAYHTNPGPGTVAPLGGGWKVKTNGKTDPERIADPFTIVNGHIVPSFEVTGARPQLLYAGFSSPNGDFYSEMVLVDGRNVLQLTDFHRPDTFQLGGFIVGGRVFFPASTNKTKQKQNPDEICQLFSIDTLGRGLRQLTRLPFDGKSLKPNCAAADETLGAFSQDQERGCSISNFFVDPIAGTVLFASSCDPLGANPFGEQIFSMRPDGTGLRQLTRARGMTTDPDGTIHVELPGPFVYPSRHRG